MTRLDPLGASVFGTETIMESDAPLVVFFGDSRARQWPAPSLAQGVKVINRGLDGHTAVQSRMRLDRDIRPLQPDIVVLQVGVNDLIGVSYLPAERDAIVANTQASITAIVNEAQGLGATVVLTTIFPPGRPLPWERALGFEDVETVVREVNAWMAGLAGQEVVVVDTAVILADASGQVRNAYREDTWHLNAAGYDALNVALEPLLNELLP